VSGGAGLAIFAGRGALPRLIAEECDGRGRPCVVVTFDEAPPGWLRDRPLIRAAFEKPGRLFADLRRAGCGSVTFAGGMQRPKLNPARFDTTMLRLAPRVLAGLKGGDDALLRLLAGVFEKEGFVVRAPHELLEGLVLPEGVLTQAAPSAQDRADAARAAQIVAALGSVDVGQASVVAQGVCIGLESIQGTDALLDFVAQSIVSFRPDPDGARGVLFKGPKPGQDWRIDLPAIGPDTIRAIARAGLAGVAGQAGGVLLLGRAETLEAADAAGLFVWGREASE